MSKRQPELFQKLLWAVCAWHSRAGSRARIVQIGANDGRIGDPIYALMLRFRSATRLLLIEPQDEVISLLRENYASHDDAQIWIGAVGEGSSLSLYRLKERYYGDFNKRHRTDRPILRVVTGFTSTKYDHVLQRIRGNLPGTVFPEEAIEEIVRPCGRLASVLVSAGWQDETIEVLQVDAEGADDEVIYASDLDKLNPVMINFEHRHIPEARLQTLKNFLMDMGFKLVCYSPSDTVAIHAGRARVYGISLTA